jgi:twinkle protein
MLAEKLARKGIHLPALKPGSYKIACPECSSSRRKKQDPCLSVTVQDDDRAVFHCHHCGLKGGVGGARPTHETRPPPRAEAYRTPTLPARRAVTDWLLGWFAKRGIPEDVVREFGCFETERRMPGEAGWLRSIAFPYIVGGVTANIKYRADIVMDAGPAKAMVQEKDALPCLFNADQIAGDELIFAEGETDVMSFAAAGYRSVVSLANGAGREAKFNPHDKRFAPLSTHADALVKVKKILIATDADEAGHALAEELARRFGYDRCLRVRWPEGCKDANDVLVRHGASSLRLHVERARPWPIEGIVWPDDVRDELLALWRGRPEQGVSCGVADLDQHWRLQPGLLNVVTGIPNHGKSAFIEQVVVRLSERQGWRWALFSPEHSAARQLLRLIERYGRMPVLGREPRISESDLHCAIDWLDEHVVLVRPEKESPTIEAILERARWAALRLGIRGLVIDPWNQLENQRPKQMMESEYIGDCLRRAKQFAIHHGVCVIIVAHPTKLQRQADGNRPAPTLYDISGSANWSNMCDAGLTVHRDFDTNEVTIFVRKIRDQPDFGQPGEIKLRFNPASRCFESIAR